MTKGACQVTFSYLEFMLSYVRPAGLGNAGLQIFDFGYNSYEDLNAKLHRRGGADPKYLVRGR